ncbi:MAG TPA: DsbA family protein [Methylocystis sp.]|nr:DsbA family protein [Methylocystis sp.]
MRINRLAAATLVVCGALLGAAPARAGDFSAEQKIEIGAIVHDYLLNNPEVVKDAIDALEKKEKVIQAAAREKSLDSDADRMFRSQSQAVVGNPDGDVTIVEFFDYNCGYCKQSLANVAKLVESDPKVRVVLKDFAILGPDSVEAAEVATAVRKQLNPQKFWEFHKRLLGTRGHVGKAQAIALAKDLGADPDQLEKDAKSPGTHQALTEVEQLADEMKFDGTPAWVIGKEAFVGGVSYASLKAKVDNVRKCGKTAC